MEIKIFADGANLQDIAKRKEEGVVKGFTTNPSLMKKANVEDYWDFAKKATSIVGELPISYEVFSDDLDTMYKEAKKIATLGENVYVKIPVVTTKGESTSSVIKQLSLEGVNINVTAVLTLAQVEESLNAFTDNSKNIISVFAGRVADTGIDPLPLMKKSKELCSKKDNVELLWASSREVLNVIQANDIGVDIITCTDSILSKLPMLGKDHYELSIETVQGFQNDIKELGYSIL